MITKNWWEVNTTCKDWDDWLRSNKIQTFQHYNQESLFRMTSYKPYEGVFLNTQKIIEMYHTQLTAKLAAELDLYEIRERKPSVYINDCVVEYSFTYYEWYHSKYSRCDMIGPTLKSNSIVYTAKYQDMRNHLLQEHKDCMATIYDVYSTYSHIVCQVHKVWWEENGKREEYQIDMQELKNWELRTPENVFGIDFENYNYSKSHSHNKPIFRIETGILEDGKPRYNRPTADPKLEVWYSPTLTHAISIANQLYKRANSNATGYISSVSVILYTILNWKTLKSASILKRLYERI